MDRYAIINVTKQLCEKETIDLLKQYISLETFEQIDQFIKKLFENEKTLSPFQNEKIIIRDFQYHLIQQNGMSSFHALAQLESIEETILLILTNKEEITEITFHNLELILTIINSEIKNNIYKIANLEIKYFILKSMQKIISTEGPIHIQFEQLLKIRTLNYRYLLGYELIEETIPELETYSQSSFYKSNKIPPSRETRMESAIYHRMDLIDKKYNKILQQNMTIEILDLLKTLFHSWKKDIKQYSEQMNSLPTIVCLWYEIIDAIKKILEKTQNTKGEDQIDGQLDLWSFQKKKSSIPND